MNERQWKGACVAAMIVLVFLAGYNFLSPQPAPAQAVAKRQAEVRKLETELETFRNDVTKDRKLNQSRLWTQSGDQLGAEAMKIITGLAQANRLKVVAFRPQRSQTEGELTRYGYLAALDGSFPAVMGFLSSLESQAKRLALSSIQISSADGASDRVTASVSVVAFRQEVPKK